MVRKIQMKYRLILFDADGTIFDDDQPIIRAIKRGFVEKNLKAPSEEVILKHSGYSAREWVELVAKDEGYNLSKEDLDKITHQAVRVLTGFFFKVLGKEMHGAMKTIHELHKHHVKTALVTNAPISFTREALRVLKMENLFTRLNLERWFMARLTRDWAIRLQVTTRESPVSENF